MRHEIAPAVLKILDEGIAMRAERNIYDVLKKMGVSNPFAEKFEYTWELPGGSPIFTIWAERVCVHPVSGRMFYVENLEPDFKLQGGKPMEPRQIDRTRHRRELLNRVKDGRSFIAVLQSNKTSKEALDANEISRPELRIKDSPWRVASWEEKLKRAIFVRGDDDWRPTDEEIEQFVATGQITPPQATASQDADLTNARITFPDQDHRDHMEQLSMQIVMDHFRAQNLKPQNVSSKNLGYDIDVLDLNDVSTLHVEVKGTASDKPGFFLTRNERNVGAVDPLWELIVVVDLLKDPYMEHYSFKDVERHFTFTELAWRCDPR